MIKRLTDLFKDLPIEFSGRDVDVSDVVIDSRAVKAGSLFIALKGVKTDGHRYIDSAVAAGASALLVQDPVTRTDIPVARTANPLSLLATLSLRFWDNPSQNLLMIGLTGTNGKTTISYLVESIFKQVRRPLGVMGTVQYRFGSTVLPAPNTTPFPTELHRFLSQLVQQKAAGCVMEVSSHALELGRVEGVAFDVGVFTNLTQDHLDFHKTMDAYAAAKQKLFRGLNPANGKPFPKAAVLNADDPASAVMRDGCRVPVITYALRASADITVKYLQYAATGTRFDLHYRNQSVPIALPLIGDYNVANALAAAGAALSQQLSLNDVRAGLENAEQVPGRVERVTTTEPFTVLVDYAHTDDALRKVLETLRKLKPKRLVTIFGCGGDRDRTKRPLMGETAASLSDEVWITSDNPRSEDPKAIALDIEVGVRRVRSSGYHVVLDRQEAIEQSLGLAREGDIFLIAGKGHETYQIFKDRTISFDDRDVARTILKKRK